MKGKIWYIMEPVFNNGKEMYLNKYKFNLKEFFQVNNLNHITMISFKQLLTLRKKKNLILELT
jgi:hypothetical protein